MQEVGKDLKELTQNTTIIFCENISKQRNSFVTFRRATTPSLSTTKYKTRDADGFIAEHM